MIKEHRNKPFQKQFSFSLNGMLRHGGHLCFILFSILLPCLDLMALLALSCLKLLVTCPPECGRQ